MIFYLILKVASRFATVCGCNMEFQSSSTNWAMSLFDVSEPYLYVVVLPALVLLALGFRSLALASSLGAAALFTILGAT